MEFENGHYDAQPNDTKRNGIQHKGSQGYDKKFDTQYKILSVPSVAMLSVAILSVTYARCRNLFCYESVVGPNVVAPNMVKKVLFRKNI